MTIIITKHEYSFLLSITIEKKSFKLVFMISSINVVYNLNFQCIIKFMLFNIKEEQPQSSYKF